MLYDYTTDTSCIVPPGYARYGPPPGGGTVAAPARQAKPEKEYIAGGIGYRSPSGSQVLPSVVDEQIALHGPRLYDAMDRDPACRSAKNILKLAIVAGGMDLAPAEKPKAGVKELTPDEQLAADLVDEIWRHVEGVPDFEQTAFSLLEAVRVGAKLAEPTCTLAPDGPDKGKLVLESLRVKPNTAWQFIVDEHMAVTGIQARPTDGSPPVVFPPDKFVWLSWDPQDGDPRGSSIYQPAVGAWLDKRRALPELYKHLTQFGSASLVGNTAPGEIDVLPLDEHGNVVPGAPLVSPEQRMSQSMEFFRNGFVIAIPAEAKITAIQPQGDGSAFHKALDFYNREITQAILLQTRATMEAEHGSKADSQTGQDMFGLLVEMGRKSLAGSLRRLFRWLITLNHGPDVAARLTPLVTFGQTDQQDRPATWNALAALKSSEYIGESQLAELDQMAGLPMRDAEADEAKAKAKAEEALKQQQELAPKPGAAVPADEAKPGATKPPARPKPKPATFAAGDDDEDMREALAMVSAAFPSAAAYRRWQSGDITQADRLDVLQFLRDGAKDKLTADAQAMLRELMAQAEFSDLATFASPFEVVSRWRDAAARTLRRAFLAGALVLLGPGELQPVEAEALRGANQVQVQYLDQFASDVLSGKQARDGTVGGRAGMYGQSVWGVAQQVSRARAIADGKTQERRVHVGDDTPCKGCRVEAAKGWQPTGTLKPIGECECMSGCHCHLEYR